MIYPRTCQRMDGECDKMETRLGRLRDALEEIKTTLNHRGSYGPEDEAWEIAHNALAKDSEK